METVTPQGPELGKPAKRHDGSDGCPRDLHGDSGTR